MIMPIYLNGLMLGLSLIMALGPQNIFLIRQGALRQHAVLSAVTCFICDVVLVTASIAGLHHILEQHPDLRLWMAWFGAGFLLYYGGAALKRAFSRSARTLGNEQTNITRWQIIMLALGFSLLNPHAIIDSLVLIGGGSSQFPDHPQMFLFGVISSSLVWFTVLTITAYYFSGILTKTTVWRRVELCSGILMIYLSLNLVSSQV
ncbi:lysine efflux permease [Legionella oakridgensis ATCC 33761 = DSM 21215]|uniref:Lysine efflux permease n=3 Tax=Legionella oakridgensis TaxID=29423 RepID=W0BET8_9GAMM|nr:LysE family transporter [Legionella oakridgensis]AHE68370.1 lysine efflux permease [Legionella oakridgensis ATCC 33761 = DSM 21215]KTD38961.1 LysE family transporter [Legionella oakridgensis]STY21311.1 LysE family transporter [Legionella longbeachae]